MPCDVLSHDCMETMDRSVLSSETIKESAMGNDESTKSPKHSPQPPVELDDEDLFFSPFKPRAELEKNDKSRGTDLQSESIGLDENIYPFSFMTDDFCEDDDAINSSSTNFLEDTVGDGFKCNSLNGLIQDSEIPEAFSERDATADSASASYLEDACFPLVNQLVQNCESIDIPKETQNVLRKQPDDDKHLYNANKVVSEDNPPATIQPTLDMVPPPVIPPTSENLPMVLPHLMQPQFGLPLSDFLGKQIQLPKSIDATSLPPSPSSDAIFSSSEKSCSSPLAEKEVSECPVSTDYELQAENEFQDEIIEKDQQIEENGAVANAECMKSPAHMTQPDDGAVANAECMKSPAHMTQPDVKVEHDLDFSAVEPDIELKENTNKHSAKLQNDMSDQDVNHSSPLAAFIQEDSGETDGSSDSTNFFEEEEESIDDLKRTAKSLIQVNCVLSRKMNKTMKSLENQNKLIQLYKSTIHSQNAQNERQADDLGLIYGSAMLRAFDSMAHFGILINNLSSTKKFTGEDRENMDELVDIFATVPHDCLREARERIAETLLKIKKKEEANEKKKTETQCPDPKKMANSNKFGRKKRNRREATSRDAVSTSKLPNSEETFQQDIEEVLPKKIPSKRNRKKKAHASGLNLEENFTSKNKILIKETEPVNEMRSTINSVNKVTSGEKKTETEDCVPKKMVSSTEFERGKKNNPREIIEDAPSDSKLQNLDKTSEQDMEEIPSTKLPSRQNSKKKAQKRKQKAQANDSGSILDSGNFSSNKEIAIKKTEPIKKMRNTSINDVPSEDKKIETESSAPQNIAGNIEFEMGKENNPREVIITDALTTSKLPNLDRTSEQDMEEVSSEKLPSRQNSKKKVQASDLHLSLDNENFLSDKKTAIKKTAHFKKRRNTTNSINEVPSEDKKTETEGSAPKNMACNIEFEREEKNNPGEIITEAAPSTSKLPSRQNYKKRAQKRKKKAQANESSSSLDNENVSSNKKISVKETEPIEKMQSSSNSSNVTQLRNLIIALSDFMIDPSADENQYVAQYKQEHCSKSNEKKEVGEADDVVEFKDVGE